MHRLCHLLNEAGIEAYVTAKNTNPDWNTPVYDESGFDKDNTVVIYPECIPDNLLDAKYVVRWLLFHQIAEYAPSDYVFKLHAHYHSIEDKCDGLLEVFDYDMKSWKKLNLYRNNQMIAYRKGRWKKDFVNLNYDEWMVYDEYEKHEDENILCEVMNSCKKFICFDDSSFIPIQAVLCGCETMVVPMPDVNAEQYRALFPVFKYGIAYGSSPNEIERAKYTKHLVKRHIEKINDSSKDSVQKFIEYWQNELEK
jgi:hypothetical protein